MYAGLRKIVPTYLPISCHYVQLRLETKLLKILTDVVTRGDACEAPRPGRDVMDEKLGCIQHKHNVTVIAAVKLYRQGN